MIWEIPTFKLKAEINQLRVEHWITFRGSVMSTVITFKLGVISGNVYLAGGGDSFVLIDTGLRSKRFILEKKLEEHKCESGKLKCILLTHGDFDHCGNALYLSRKFKIPIGVNKNDAAILENGDMFINRKKKNKIISVITKKLMGMEKFTPDFYLENMNDLTQFGIDAKVIHTPGHSPGSVCIITSDGECFCGDLFENIKKPQINKIVDDYKEMNNSFKKIIKYDIETIYPGHGAPFLKKDLI